MPGQRGVVGVWSEGGGSGQRGCLGGGSPILRGVSHFLERVSHFRENGGPPAPTMLEYGQCTVGTHPTGMHTYLL